MDRRALFALALVPRWAPSDPPALTPGDQLLLETTQVMGTIVGACDRLSLYGKYTVQRALVQSYLETQYPGWSVEWGVLPAVLKAKSP